MPDWTRLVDERIAPAHLEPDVQREVVAEIASHLEECHDELRKDGSADPQGQTLAQVPDWITFSRDIRRAKEDRMSIVRKVLVPGAAAVVVALGSLRLLAALLVPLQPCATGSDCVVQLVSADGPAYLPWLATLAMTGALTAWLARRLGAHRRQRLVAALFPAIYLGIETTVMSVVDPFFWRIPIFWVLIPALVCAISA